MQIRHVVHAIGHVLANVIIDEDSDMLGRQQLSDERRFRDAHP